MANKHIKRYSVLFIIRKCILKHMRYSTSYLAELLELTTGNIGEIMD